VRAHIYTHTHTAKGEALILKTLAVDKITFEANAAEMTEKGLRLVSKVSGAIRGLGDMAIHIHGHCKCDCGNMHLSQARAQAVADKLTEEGCTNKFVVCMYKYVICICMDIHVCTICMCIYVYTYHTDRLFHTLMGTLR